MSLEDRKKRLDALIARRNICLQNIQRVSGRLDLARKEKEQVEAECRAKNIDPEKLPEIIARLEAKFDEDLEKLELQLSKAESEIAPFLEKI